ALGIWGRGDLSHRRRPERAAVSPAAGPQGDLAHVRAEREIDGAAAMNSDRSVRLRLREIAGSGRLAYELLIAPWPPFALFLIAAGAVGGATPLLQIKVISGLINALTPRAGGVPGARTAPRFEV